MLEPSVKKSRDRLWQVSIGYQWYKTSANHSFKVNFRTFVDLGPATIMLQTSGSKVDKVLLKAVNKKNKKDPKTFTLHNLKQSETGS